MMPAERTLSMIKPDAVRRDLIGEIYRRFERAGLRIVAAKMLRLSRERAEEFYAVHRGRPFYEGLIEFMISGPVMVQVLEAEDAVSINREVMGLTDPKKCAPGTIRADFAGELPENAVHGSDSPENARLEIDFFFSPDEICPRP
jgi:nucleoside-diphosphate kinase